MTEKPANLVMTVEVDKFNGKFTTFIKGSEMTSQAGMVETLFCVLFFFSRFSQIFKNLPNIFVESIFEQG